MLVIHLRLDLTILEVCTFVSEEEVLAWMEVDHLVPATHFLGDDKIIEHAMGKSPFPLHHKEEREDEDGDDTRT
ncbi:hypothetical protein AVEN_160802-1 [Araneus ventricosus]|uniref:Uncharacterized protein n=1 Tax=Araneus ventricosus TaxID=182803 RepID=A0A4Y2HPA2_ARAVE|nr:hypothetical protein AVEN_160802-1 [Araneus ventricosus]